ncbi:hypothetical protein KP509_27G046800 [Ceratopteris richardii]|uniref:PHD-type domain-containing protein n=1 Tax=Ceratopteris richardii TaxID=49495 RepID=A0A8T2RG81_CERRI|nr:hypothetical protein KP509_27G046800 [Ceratopteris richardii]
MEGTFLPRTIEEIYKDYRGRRAAIIKALTVDVESFYQQCDPERDNLCLYGFPDETWEVDLPAEEVPAELPEPALGINFPRDGLGRREWLSLVAVHSDAWLLSIASFHAARYETHDRKRLFSTICDLPTVLEVLSGRKQAKEKSTVSNGSKTKSSGKTGKGLKQSSTPAHKEEDTEENDEEHGDTYCGSCNGPYSPEEFWIACDVCEKWYHGTCVKITPSKAEHIKEYRCPACLIHKRPRP